MSVHDSKDYTDAQPQTTMDTPDKYEIAYAMQQHGTPFIKALANAIILANDNELYQIRFGLRKILAEYEEMARENMRQAKASPSD